MPAQTPQQLATNSVCYRCLDASPWVSIYLAGLWAGVTNPQTISTNSTAFQGFMGNEAAAAAAYMLAVIAGGSLDPNVLAIDARCYPCLDGQLDLVDNYLLALLSGGSTDPQAIATAAASFRGVPIMQSLLYLFSVKSGVSAALLPSLSRCFLCAGSELDRIITMLLTDIQGGVLP